MQEGENLYNEIAVVAYEPYERRGKIHGYDVEDWIEAEKIVMKKHAKETAHEAEVVGSIKREKAANKTKPKTLKLSKKTPDKTTKETKDKTEEFLSTFHKSNPKFSDY